MSAVEGADTTAQLREQIAAIRAEHEAHNYRVTALRNPHDCDGCDTDGTAKWDVLWSNEGRDEEPFLCDDCLAREFREIRLCDALDAALAQVEAAKATARRDALTEIDSLSRDEQRAMDLWWKACAEEWAVPDWLPGKFLTEVLRASAQGAAAPAEVCSHPDWSFDRTICGMCDSMPMVCVECGWHDCQRPGGQGAQSSGLNFTPEILQAHDEAMERIRESERAAFVTTRDAVMP